MFRHDKISHTCAWHLISVKVYKMAADDVMDHFFISTTEQLRGGSFVQVGGSRSTHQLTIVESQKAQ